MSEPRVVTIGKRKLGGARACWNAYDLGSDDDGRWLFTPAGSLFRSSDRGVDSSCEVEGGGGPGLDSIVLVPDPSEHWLAAWSLPGRSLHIAIEICGWVRQEDAVVVFTDWELDPFRLRSGLVAVEDLDDFVESRAAGLLSAREAETALRTAGWAERTLRSRRPPLDDRGDQRLAAAGRLGLSPLVDVPHPFEV